MPDNKFEQQQTEESVKVNEVSQKNIFDAIGDFFAKMLKGIFIFVFCKIPVNLWNLLSDIEQLKKLLKYLYSIIRAIVLCAIWIVVVFIGWWFFLREQFIKFWLQVWDLVLQFYFHTLVFLKENAGWIWMILALCGSIYGLLYVTLKRRSKRLGKDFHGVFGWLKKSKNSDNTQADKG